MGWEAHGLLHFWGTLSRQQPTEPLGLSLQGLRAAPPGLKDRSLLHRDDGHRGCPSLPVSTWADSPRAPPQAGPTAEKQKEGPGSSGRWGLGGRGEAAWSLIDKSGR